MNTDNLSSEVDLPMPLLSIVMITYRHEQYVARALASILEQELPFTWELIISDDASDDETSTIIESTIAGREHITFVRQPQNLGMQRNYEFVMRRCRGKYVAQLEGDDYWTDPQKSIKQISLLERYPDMAWCFTNGVIIDSTDQVIGKIQVNLPDQFSLLDYCGYFRSINPLNNTVMFRRSCDPVPYPDFIMRIVQIDTALHFLRAREHTIGFLSDSTMAYRRHPTSSAAQKLRAGAAPFLQWIQLYDGLRPLMPKEVAATFDDRATYFYIARAYLAEGDHGAFIRYWLKSAGHPTWRDSLHYLKLWLLGFFRQGY